ncbi:MAG: hypothetical protein JRC68_02820 [Deltaproteobacteria bacterium]|nr:hypothetical protein [Deltaproteobacteria bacterium]
MGFAKSVADSKGFRGIKPKYLTTAEDSGISKRYRLEETAIASFDRHPFWDISNAMFFPLNRDIGWAWIY